MEKRRRARINESLGQLKTLILDALKKDVSSLLKVRLILTITSGLNINASLYIAAYLNQSLFFYTELETLQT